MTEALPLWVTVPGTVLLVCGGLLMVIGSLGLVRMKDFYSRMHPPTMGATLGTGSVLVASMLVSSALLHRPVIHEALIAVLVFITAPVTAMLLARAAAYRSRARERDEDR
jgi:multicomponent K+:H+ antiporter subunit G